MHLPVWSLDTVREFRARIKGALVLYIPCHSSWIRQHCLRVVKVLSKYHVIDSLLKVHDLLLHHIEWLDLLLLCVLEGLNH